nr:RHS repeat domain-containing protein [Brockia lithotrophica]
MVNFVYDSQGKLIRVGQTEYVYDAEGNRIAVIDQGVRQTKCVVDPEWG